MDNLGYGRGVFDRDDAVFEPSDEARGEQDGGYRPSAPPVRMHVTGTQLRRRLITPEVVAAIHAEEPKQSLVQDLLGRVRKRG